MALKVKGQGQMLPKSKYFWVYPNTYSNQLNYINCWSVVLQFFSGQAHTWTLDICH